MATCSGRLLRVLLTLALLCGAYPSILPAQVPHTLNYQGYLTTGIGTPVTATVSMQINLYTVETLGAAIYTETQNVSVANGVFNVVIGTPTPIPGAVTFNQQYWVGIAVNGDPEMTPRRPLTASPYALRAAGLDSSAPLPAGQITGTIGTTQLADGAVTPAKLSANFAGSASAGGPATTALALAANGTNCPGGQFAAGVDGQGNAEGCASATPQDLTPSGSPTFAGLTVTGSVTLPSGSIPVSALASSPMFGNGADGPFNFIGGTTTLTQDMYATNLTLATGATLNTGGFRIFVRDTLTMSGTATISNNGSNGAGSGGNGAPAGTVGGGSKGGAGSLGAVGGSGTALTNAVGGTGGSGGGNGNTGGTPGVLTAPAAVDGGADILNAVPNALTGRLLSSVIASGGSGGGGGGSSVGGVLGGGGGGGGVVVVAARKITGTGKIQANGGNGNSGAAGGGGGGGGAVVIVTANPIPATVTVTASGGTAGSSAGGTAAVAGAPGTVVILF